MHRIGYLGPKGTFAYDAVITYTKAMDCELMEFPEISELIHAVDSGKVEKALVPIENALEGTVNITADMLVHEVNVKIIGEVVLPIRHYLLARPGIDLKDVKLVLSHPQALAQCRKYLYNNLKGIEQRPVASTAAAAREVASVDLPWAAIANKKAGEIFGLKALSEDIQDHLANSTRFVVLSKTRTEPTGDDKTSIAFTVANSPGSLLEALKLFADKKINLTKIESRPMKTLLGQYMFLVDFEGHASDELISGVLYKLSCDSKFFVFLGSYPKHKDANGG
jgi:prephenate dehydratase